MDSYEVVSVYKDTSDCLECDLETTLNDLVSKGYLIKEVMYNSDRHCYVVVYYKKN